jgi:hypothetical protein
MWGCRLVDPREELAVADVCADRGGDDDVLLVAQASLVGSGL